MVSASAAVPEALAQPDLQALAVKERRVECLGPDGVCWTVFTTRDPDRELCDQCLADAAKEAAKRAAGRRIERAPVVSAAAEHVPARWLEQVEQAVRKNAEVLRSGGRWCDPAFTFARELRRFEDWAELGADEAADRAEACFHRLYQADPDRLPFYRLPAEQVAWVQRHCPQADRAGWVSALGVIDRHGRGPHDPLEAFLAAWGALAARPGAMDVALDRAAEYCADPAVFGADLAAPRRAKFRRFLAVCRELSRASEDGGEFFLPCSTWAERLETDPDTVARWRREGVRRGFLEKTVAEARHSGGNAARFRWVGP